MKEKLNGTTIGVSLIFVVFLVLAFIIFGTLTFLLSKTNNELSISVSDNITQYYYADMLALEKLEEIDNALQQISENCINKNEYVKMLEEEFSGKDNIKYLFEDNHSFLSFTTKVSDKEVILSKIRINELSIRENYLVIEWKLKTFSN